MTAKVYIVFHSFYGHIYRMAQAVAEGAKSVDGVEVKLWRVPETVPDEILEKVGAKQAQEAFADVPVIKPEQLAEADAIIVGTGTRFGNMTAQMRNFWDQTGQLWAKGALVDKIGSVFTGTATQHGGQETTIIATMITLLHHGMVIAGVPFTEPGLNQITELTGGSPYGAGTISGGDGSRQASENELNLARVQGRRVAELAKKIKG